MVARPAVPQNLPCNEWATADQIIPHIAANLALVRPVSMNDEAAAEWLAVAATELDGYVFADVKAALSKARATCTHHGQILPTVLQNMKDAQPWRLGKPLARRPMPPVSQDPRIASLVSKAASKLRITQERQA